MRERNCPGFSIRTSRSPWGLGVVAVVTVASLALNGCVGLVSGANSNPTGPTPLNISNIQILSATTSTCQIAWTTDVPSNSAIQYGTTVSYGSSTAVDPTMVTSHTVTVTNLAPAGTYYYQVLSTDSRGNHGQSGGHNFKTTGLNISGSISPAPGGSGTTVALTGAGTATTTADASGNFTFSGLPNGAYMVTPSRAGYTFSPTNQSVTLNGNSASGVIFTATAQTFSISGAISPAAGANGATVILSGSSSATTTANPSGTYTFTGLLSGSYVVTPSNSGYTFSPASQNVSISISNVTGVNFTANSIPVTPTITTQPVSQTVTAGQTATFTVVATGTAPLSYQWQKNGANISGAISSSYTTPATTTSDNGSTFDVVVSNSAGSVTSASVALNVSAAPVAPTIATQPASQTVMAGQTATFTVLATGTAPLNYQWQRNGTNISGATGASYTTPATTTADSGSSFHVVVSNTAGAVTSAAATLTVNAAATFSISGTINSLGGAGATVTLGGAAAATTTANSSGAYTFTGLANGTYTVTPSQSGYSFSPATLNETVNGSNITGANFVATAQTFSISGTISPTAAGNGATVTLSGAASATTTANSSGAYTFTGLADGTYAITPSQTGYTFSPVSQSVTISGANVTGKNFTGTQTFSLSGSISPVTGGSGATVTLTGATNALTTTNSSGAYTFTGLANGSYTVTPTNTGYSFTPTSQNVSINGANAAGINFTAAAQSHYVTLSWIASTSVVSGYNVYRGTVSGGPDTKLNATLITALTYTDLSVTAGQTYYYVATAVDSSGAESVYSNQVQAVIP